MQQSLTIETLYEFLDTSFTLYKRRLTTATFTIFTNQNIHCVTEMISDIHKEPVKNIQLGTQFLQQG